VYHCAAHVAGAGPWTDFDESNIRGTEHLLSAAAAAGVSRFVHVSSIGVYGPLANGHTQVTEADGYDRYPWRRGFYTWSKIESDRLAIRQGRQNGEPAVVVIRPGLLYGPGAKTFTARLQKSLGSKVTLIVGGPGTLLPLAHVDSVVDALLRVGQGRGQPGEAYNIVDRPVTQNEYLAWRRRAAPRRPRVVYLPLAVVCGLATVMNKVRRGRYRSLRYRLMRVGQSVVYDTAKAEQELGWQPAAMPR